MPNFTRLERIKFAFEVVEIDEPGNRSSTIEGAHMLRLFFLVAFLFCELAFSAAQQEDATLSGAFPFSVASGDPSADGFLLMTHLDRRYFNAGYPQIRLEVSASRDFRSLVVDSTFNIDPSIYDRELEQWPIKADIHDLQSWTRYFYRFSYGQYQSPIGRAHTLPWAGQNIEQLSLALVTCQDYSTGHYVAYKHLAEDKDIDFVVHLGDAIYEYDRYPGFSDDKIIHKIHLPDGVAGLGTERGVRKATSLRDYRHIYALERRDIHFRKALENHTFIFTLDDHELWDNASWDYKYGTPTGPVHDPRRGSEFVAPMANALRAWTEFLPVRSSFDPSKAKVQDQLINPYRSYRFGNLGELYALNSRIFRSNSVETDIKRTMLGDAQKRWLLDGLRNSTAKWQLLGNQTLMAPFKIGNKRVNLDAWDGYRDERHELLGALAERSRVAVFTGDMHTSLVSYLLRDYSYARDAKNIVGAEFMTPSISSPHFSDSIRSKIHIGTTALSRKLAKSSNSHFKHFHGSIYGYSIATLRNDNLDWKVYKVDKRNENSALVQRKHMLYDATTKKISKLRPGVF